VSYDPIIALLGIDVLKFLKEIGLLSIVVKRSALNVSKRETVMKQVDKWATM
jgi:hypothetical protein